jgi:hypothetical protein
MEPHVESRLTWITRRLGTRRSERTTLRPYLCAGRAIALANRLREALTNFSATN